jgi:hypothetical protein
MLGKVLSPKMTAPSDLAGVGVLPELLYLAVNTNMNRARANLAGLSLLAVAAVSAGQA